MNLSKERRKGILPVPENVQEYLNDSQTRSLREVKRFGWVLFAVRRPLFQRPAVIVTNVDTNRFGVLLEDGTIDYTPEITIRAAQPSGRLSPQALKFS